nr:MAG TPA: C2H2 type zinc-finger protein [Caudoviricetes sp.]
MRARLTKDCYCYTCGRAFNYLGIASHRASHRRRRRREYCTIRKPNGDVTMIVSNHYIPVSILVKGQTTIGSR